MKQTLNFLLMLVMVASIFSCKKKDPEPLAAFTFTPDTGRSPITVTFTNTSVNADTYAWDFGGGAPASTEKNPVVNFATGGTFVVTLTATGAGGSTKVTKSITLLPAIVGKYKATAYTTTSNGIVGNNFDGRPACEVDDITEFTADGKMFFTEGATSCTPPNVTPGTITYIISADNKSITIKSVDGNFSNTRVWIIEESTNTALKISRTFTYVNTGVTVTAKDEFTYIKI